MTDFITPSSPPVTALSSQPSSPEAQFPPSQALTALILASPSPAMAHLHDADFRPEMFVPEGTNIEAPWEGGHQGRTTPFKVISRGLMRR